MRKVSFGKWTKLFVQPADSVELCLNMRYHASVGIFIAAPISCADFSVFTGSRFLWHLSAEGNFDKAASRQSRGLLVLCSFLGNMGRYFTLPLFSAQQARVPQKAQTLTFEVVAPYLASITMGFSWGMYCCQDAERHSEIHSCHLRWSFFQSLSRQCGVKAGAFA